MKKAREYLDGCAAQLSVLTGRSFSIKRDHASSGRTTYRVLDGGSDYSQAMPPAELARWLDALRRGIEIGRALPKG